MQFKPVNPGVTRAVLWGDPAKGPYRSDSDLMFFEEGSGRFDIKMAK